MGLRLHQSFTLFPGVRLNVGKSGVSASFGVPGATVNIGPRGVRRTVGIPGTGISYSQNLPSSGGNENNPSLSQPTPQPIYYDPQPVMREIGSVSVDKLTSENLLPLKNMIVAARDQRNEIERDIREAGQTLHSQNAKLELSQQYRTDMSVRLGKSERSFFRRFLRKRIALLTAEIETLDTAIVEMEKQIPDTKAEIIRLNDWKNNTRIEMGCDMTDMAERAYERFIKAFEALCKCSVVWDVTSDRSLNNADRIAERVTANRTIDHKPVTIGFANSDLIRFDGQAMRFGNANGSDMLIYPSAVLMPRADGNFALIDILSLRMKFEGCRFTERDRVPSDATVVDRTWAKSNRDGTRDRRFADNYEIPVCLYATLAFTTDTGLTEEFMFPQAKVAGEFGMALHAYQGALVNLDVTQLAKDDPENHPALKDWLEREEDDKDDEDVFYIAGTRYRSDDTKSIIRQLDVGTRLELQRDPENEYDANAIKIILPMGKERHFLGFVPSDIAEDLSPKLAFGARYYVKVLGFSSEDDISPLVELHDELVAA